MPTDENTIAAGAPRRGPLLVGGAGRARRSARPAVRRPGADWATLNEPINYLLASYGIGIFPPGRGYLLPDFPRLVAAYRTYLAAHVAVYRAIKENDTFDADGDSHQRRGGPDALGGEVGGQPRKTQPASRASRQ
ncbi:MAG: hypothetical protein R3F60_05150 [bacterium]